MNLKNKYLLLLLLFFVIAAVIRINLDGLPLTHPGNIKAADPVYHTTITDIIKDTHQWKYYPDYIAFGIEKSINQQPPLVYTNAAMLSLFSSIPSWSTVYFIICLMAALRILLIYLITQEIFKNKKISILAAALYVIPFKPDIWLYETYIGFWIQVFSLTFLIAFAWLFIKYLKERTNGNLISLSIVTTGVIASHPQDLLYLVIPALYLIYDIIKRNKENITKVKKLAYLGLAPGISFLVLLPWFLFVWRTSQYNLAWNSNPFPTDYLGGITTPGIQFIPWFLLVLAALGIIISILAKSKYKLGLLVTGYYLFFIIILPRFLSSPHYLGRTGSLLPVALAPFMAVAIYYIISQLDKLTKIKINKTITFLVLSLLIVLAAYPSVKDLQNNLQGEHIDQVTWESYQWIKTNTPEDAKFFFFMGCDQAGCAYTERSTASLPINEYIQEMQTFIETNVFKTKYNFGWAIDTYWDYPSKEISRFHFQTYDKEILRNKHTDLTEFEYVYLRDFNQDIAMVNQKIITEGLQPLGYQVVYQQNGITILGK